MRKIKAPVVILLLLAMSLMLVAPVATASASPLSDLLSPASSSGEKNSSNGGIFSILLGLLLGKLVGNTSGDSSDIAKVLGVSTTAPANTDGAAIVATAKKYMGVPYVWGGETTSGFDCSGFTQYVMRERGIAIGRTAADQFAAGLPVDKANLQVGDMVFFTTYKPGASHVGFYVGNGEFINASSSAKQVTISSLDETYWKERYIGARRYIR
ncbi:MAG TPA: NlpC/P60 family protein [Selenomonadales bacterium]|nr:NlpC/P60 family protein [Selenomonadales bacterium]